MIKVQQADFDLAEELKALENAQNQTGAVVSFIGLVREFATASDVSAMVLEHYPGMTERELERIETEARQRWSLIDSLVIHRYGRLTPGEQIVLVITTSEHRKDAFDAARFIMDFLKTSAPFWKKEETGDGSAWVEAKAEDAAARDDWK